VVPRFAASDGFSEKVTRLSRVLLRKVLDRLQLVLELEAEVLE